MIGFKHRFRPLHLIDIGHHGEDMAGAGGLDGVGKCGERADVNHGGPWSLVPIIRCAGLWAMRVTQTAMVTLRLIRVQRLEARQEPLLGLGRGPWRQVVLLGRGRQAGVAAEQAFRLGFAQSPQARVASR